ncbi:hypothetical protein [Streptomyces bauhiniae]
MALRPIRDDILVCEVTDPSNTQPRLRRAVWSDEGRPTPDPRRRAVR